MLALWLSACKPEPEPTDPGPDPEPIESTGRARTRKLGSIVMIESQADAQYYDEPETSAFGVWVDDDLGVYNLVECLTFGPPCLAARPEPGQVPEQVPAPTLTSTWFAGKNIRVGPTFLNATEIDAGHLYAGFDFTFRGDTRLTFDGDLAGYDADDAFEVPDALTGLSPDPARTVALGGGDALAMTWEPAEAGQILVRWLDGARWEVRVAEDTGATTLDADELGLAPPLDTTAVTLSRTLTTEVDANGNTVRVQVAREQTYFVDLVDTAGWTDLEGDPRLSEECQGTDPLPDGRYFGDLGDAAADLDLGDGNPLTGYQTAGRELSFAVALADGDTLEVKYRTLRLDGAVYVLDAACDPSRALAAADATLNNEEEVLVFTAEAAGVYHVVLDAFSTDQGERFSLETRTIPATR